MCSAPAICVRAFQAAPTRALCHHCTTALGDPLVPIFHKSSGDPENLGVAQGLEAAPSNTQKKALLSPVITHQPTAPTPNLFELNLPEIKFSTGSFPRRRELGEICP